MSLYSAYVIAVSIMAAHGVIDWIGKQVLRRRKD